MATQTFTADGTYLLNRAPGDASADGLCLTFTISGTTSGVLAVNTAPPGAAVSLSDIAYLNGSLALQSAGTAITASGLAYVSAENATKGDLYLVLNWTSGETVVNVAPSSLGGGGSSGGTIPAGDVTAGTFGANTGESGDYAFPDDVTVADDLTCADLVTTASATVGTTLGVTGAATFSNTVTASGTVTAAQLVSVAGTVTATGGGARGIRISSTQVAAANNDLLVGLDLARTITPGAFTGLASAGIRIAANSTAMTGNKYGIFVDTPSGATTANYGIYVAGAGITVAGGGVAVTGNSTITGTLGGVTTFTAGGAAFSSPTIGLGYATGAGGAQTQATDKATTVVSNTITTAITMNNANLAAGAVVSFTFTNSTIAATDTVLVTHQSAGTNGAYFCNAFPGAGSASIAVRNLTAGDLAEAIVLRVTVIKSVSA